MCASRQQPTTHSPDPQYLSLCVSQPTTQPPDPLRQGDLTAKHYMRKPRETARRARFVENHNGAANRRPRPTTADNPTARPSTRRRSTAKHNNYESRRSGGAGGSGVRQEKQEPHNKMWGKRIHHRMKGIRSLGLGFKYLGSFIYTYPPVFLKKYS